MPPTSRQALLSQEPESEIPEKWCPNRQGETTNGSSIGKSSWLNQLLDRSFVESAGQPEDN
eukprot:12911617-Prorocentrum_lima.AAC.1